MWNYINNARKIFCGYYSCDRCDNYLLYLYIIIIYHNQKQGWCENGSSKSQVGKP